MSSEPLVLGIETSCDETGVGIVRGHTLHADAEASSVDEHARFRGVVPEVASRAHLEAMVPTIERACETAGIELYDVDAVAVTSGPGLAGALMVGVAAAKALALGLGKPIYGVNHLAAHVAVDQLEHGPLPEPCLAMLVSGGHSSLLRVTDVTGQHGGVDPLGATIDDAAGEAFDKVARLLGLPFPGGPHIDRAAREGYDVMTAAEAPAQADVVVMLAADEDQAPIYREAVAPNLREGGALAFAHGLNIRFALISPRPDIDVFLVAPKGPGTALRSEYQEGRGMIALFAVAQDASGSAQALALSYAGAIGSGRAGILPTSFAEECEADLFNEAAVLWGVIPELIQAGFETLVEAGFSQEVAYFECLTEVKLISDLIYERGIAGMREAISNTAEFGALEGGPRIVDARTRAEMRRILAEVRSGKLVDALVADAAAGYPRLSAARAAARAHPIEAVARRLRNLREDG